MLARKVARLAVIVAAALPLYGVDSYVQETGCDLRSQEHLHIEKLKDQKLDKSLVLELPRDIFWDSLQNDWFDVPGMECSTPETCEPAMHARVQISQLLWGFSMRHWSRALKGLSGNFSIEFRDGRKFTGSFKANERMPIKVIVCM